MAAAAVHGVTFGSNLTIADNTTKSGEHALSTFCVLVRNNVGANTPVRPIGIPQNVGQTRRSAPTGAENEIM